MNVLVALIPAIVQLMGLAEQMFRNPKSGQDKKNFVMATTNIALNTLQSVSTGGQKHTWETLAGPVSQIIDAASSIAFPEHDDAGMGVTSGG